MRMRPALWLTIHAAAALAPDTRSPVKCRDARFLDAWAIAGVAAQSFYDDPAPVSYTHLTLPTKA